MAALKTLPQLRGDRLYVTDGGIETTLIYQDGLDLPLFAAIHLMSSEAGVEALRAYYRRYVRLARRAAHAHPRAIGLVLESPTWRSSGDWGERLGWSRERLAELNAAAVELMWSLRDEAIAEGDGAPDEAPLEAAHVVVSGCVGPRGDGYVAESRMDAITAEAYHREQIESMLRASRGLDMVCAITMNYVDEAVGVVRAARALRVPVAISFTVEVDGRLPTGEHLLDAVEAVDHATDSYAAYFAVNCAHTSHVHTGLRVAEATSGSTGHDSTTTTDITMEAQRYERLRRRIAGVRANASDKSHAELNEATELDRGDTDLLARQLAALTDEHLPHLAVVGGCCGTDEEHVHRLLHAALPRFLAERTRAAAVDVEAARR